MPPPTPSQVIIVEFEGPDDHVEVGTSERTDQADAARVRAARFHLKIGDPLLSGDLGRTRHRSGWKGCGKHLCRCRIRIQLAANG